MTTRRVTGALLALAGAAGFTACLASVFTGMRDVMRTDGGFCASGGPYVIAHQCSGGVMRLLMVGILGMLVAAACYAGGTSALGRPGSSAGLAAWTALFGALGWNFISLGLHPLARQGVSTGWLASGGVFWLMAAGGLVAFLAIVAGDLRDAGRPGTAVGVQPLVRAAVLPSLEYPRPSGARGWQPGGGGGWEPGGPPGWEPGGTGAWQPGGAPVAVTSPPARGTERRLAGIWLVTSLAGAGIGLALSPSLIAALS